MNKTTNIYVWREKLIGVFRKYEYAITLAAKFVMTLLVLLLMDSHAGYDARISNLLLSIIVALVCSLIPVNYISAILAVLYILELYAFSFEAMAAGAVLVLLIFLLYFRFSPRNAVMLLLVPIAYACDIHYVLAIIAGLLFGPVAAVPVILGLIITKFTLFLEVNQSALVDAGTFSVKTFANFRTMVDGILQDQSLWVMALAMAATTIVVYLVRRMVIAHAWDIAIVVGAAVQIVVLLIGDMVFDTNINLGYVFLGTVLSVLLCELIRFFVFDVDYSRIESVQFSDDDYYYYVKAVPKVMVTAPVRTVKVFNQTKDSEASRDKGRHGASRRGDRGNVSDDSTETADASAGKDENGDES